jgi:hypothetical protein
VWQTLGEEIRVAEPQPSSSDRDPHLTAAWQNFQGLPKKLTKLLEHESDRGAILILGAYVDQILALMIQSAAVNGRFGKALLDHRRPAAEFSSRILLCEAFGLIHHEEARALDLVRKIRNKAAHFESEGSGFEVLFDHPGTVNQVGELCQVFGLSTPSVEPAAVRATFELSCRLLAARLYARGLSIHPAQAPRTFREIANQRRKELEGSEWGAILDAAAEQAAKGDPELLSTIYKTLGEEIQKRIEESGDDKDAPDSERTSE